MSAIKKLPKPSPFAKANYATAKAIAENPLGSARIKAAASKTIAWFERAYGKDQS